MSDFITKLKPISKIHSIKEAVITLFLTNPIIKPERFEELINTEFNQQFQKFEKIDRVQMQFSTGRTESFSNQKPQSETIGFRFIQFQNGKTSTVLQNINEEERNIISYHTLNYKNWSTFFSSFLNTMSIINQFHTNLFITSYSLHYIDEFIWDGDARDANIIFNPDSSLLPKEFFNSVIQHYLFTSLKFDQANCFDRFEIKVTPKQKNYINISHHIIQRINDEKQLDELISSKHMEEILTFAHDHNKNFLKSILKKEVCKLINL